MKQQICTFGVHLTIDGYGGSYDLLNSKNVVERCLKDLPELMGMRTLSQVQSFWATPNHIKDPGGWTGFVVIHESHISAHTFPARGFLSADVYTCRNGLDCEKIISFFVSRFHLQDTEVNFLKRGTKYPIGNCLKMKKAGDA